MKKWCLQVGKDVPAYMTLEAALVLPIVLVVIVAIISVSFVLYNRCIAAQDAAVLCFRESIARDATLSFAPDAARAEGRAAELMEGKYFAIDGLSSSASVSGTTISFAIEGGSTPAVFVTDEVMPKGVFNFSVRCRARKTDPPLSVRRYRRATYLVWKLRESEGAENGTTQ